ncbi:unnamed protein product [Pleuronectes platessa]|uniref:Uncharacterized protein n=1 Tax=Pleuronectes platessa TaxID=8262 RepID=A0A9N7YMU7_PLEPL|nr:unnamed protein product [Pleuronectes platessa]
MRGGFTATGLKSLKDLFSPFWRKNTQPQGIYATKLFSPKANCSSSYSSTEPQWDWGSQRYPATENNSAAEAEAETRRAWLFIQSSKRFIMSIFKEKIHLELDLSSKYNNTNAD